VIQFGATNFPVNNTVEEIETLARLGFDYVEICLDPPNAHYSHIEFLREEIVAVLDAYDIGIMCHLPTFVSIADLTDSIRKASVEETLGSLEAAAELEVTKVTIHPGAARGMGQHLPGLVKDLFYQSLNQIESRARDLGITLCMENLVYGENNLRKPDDFVDIFKTFPALKMTLDLGHANVQGPEVPAEFIKRFPDRIAHIHASQNLGKKDDHFPIGSDVGTVDYETVVRLLKAIGYDSTVTLEVFARDSDYLVSSRDYLSNLFKEI
jgi:sugar phosphate isomerase/epimerase